MGSEIHRTVTGAPGPSQSSLQVVDMLWSTLSFIGMVRHSKASTYPWVDFLILHRA